LRSALTLLQSLGDWVHAAFALNNLGLLYRVKGDLEQAALYFQESREVSQQVGDPVGESAALTNLGLIHKARGELEQALGCYRADAAICAEIGDKQGLTAALVNIAIVHAEGAAWNEMERVVSKALQLAMTCGYDDLQARLRLLLGRRALAAGEVQAVAQQWREALELADQVGGSEQARIKQAIDSLLASCPPSQRLQVRKHLS
jgi:tetratricopeptide (TPR) repeat protein